MTDGTTAVSWGTDRIDLFWTAADGGLVHQVWRDGAWNDQESLGGTLASPASATAWSPDQLQVFAVFGDGARSGLGARRLVMERGSDRRLGARCRRDDLASLLGRDALGSLGASSPVVRPATRRPVSSSRHASGVS